MAQSSEKLVSLTIAIDVSRNTHRDRITTLKAAKHALKVLVQDRKLPCNADVRIVTCNRWNAQRVTIGNESGVFHDQRGEILKDIKRIRGMQNSFLLL